MDNKEFKRKLVQLVIPITFQYFMFALVPVADAMMLVKLDQDAMSAVSLATQVSFVLNLFTYTITAGVSMLVAQYWGNGDRKSIETLWGYSMKLMLPIGIVFSIITCVIPGLVMKIFTSEPSIINFGEKYLRVVSAYYIITSILQLVEVFMKNTGLVKVVTVISCSMVVVNVLLNALFIYGLFGIPKFGVEGAAMATVISSAISLVFTVWFQIKKGAVHFKLKSLINTDKHISSEFVKYSAPILGNQITWGIGFTTLSVIMGHLGSDAVAANSVVAVVKDLISCFCFALASGGAIMVGNELGAGHLEEGKRCGSKLCKLALYSGIISGFIILFSTPIILKIVNLTPVASNYLKWMLVMCVYYMVGRSMNSTVISGIFCAGGDTKFGFICDTITMWAVIIPIGAFAAFVLKAPVLVVFFLLNLDELVKLPAVYKHYVKYKWVKNLTEG